MSINEEKYIKHFKLCPSLSKGLTSVSGVVVGSNSNSSTAILKGGIYFPAFPEALGPPRAP